METLERFLLCSTTFLLHIQPLKQAGCAPAFIPSNQLKGDMETLYRAMRSAANINQL